MAETRKILAADVVGFRDERMSALYVGGLEKASLPE